MFELYSQCHPMPRQRPYPKLKQQVNCTTKCLNISIAEVYTLLTIFTKIKNILRSSLHIHFIFFEKQNKTKKKILCVMSSKCIFYKTTIVFRISKYSEIAFVKMNLRLLMNIWFVCWAIYVKMFIRFILCALYSLRT